MNKILIAIGLIFLTGPLAFAGPERSVTVDAFYFDSGNKFVCREVKMSTSAAVIISSAAPDAGLQTSVWRKRTITNLSTTSVLGLYPSNTTNTTYDYSSGVTLSSTTQGLSVRAFGNTYETNNQGAIKGIWAATEGTADTPASLAAKKGAVVCEEYWK